MLEVRTKCTSQNYRHFNELAPHTFTSAKMMPYA